MHQLCVLVISVGGLGFLIIMAKIIAIYLLAILSCGICQNYGGNQNHYSQPQQKQEYNYNTPPPPQILSHKQALNHDGNFKYLFTADNGLAQGETIAPDGTRSGGFSYIDPNGKKITLKYTAGKEGFRILEANHLPQAPVPVAPLPAPAAPGYSQPSYQQPQSHSFGQSREDDGQYRPELYEKPQPRPQYYNAAPSYQQPQYRPPQAQSAPNIQSNTIEDKEPEYNDAPGKPHSFGNGYIFEFAG